jgi:protein-tyrosine kinase
MPHLYDRFFEVIWKLLLNMGESGSGRSLVISGCASGAGTSTMAFNFASAFANNSSKKILLVDANARNPILHHKFSVHPGPGLTDLLMDRGTLGEAAVEVAPERFYFLQAGQRLNNPVNLYESSRFAAIMKEMRAMADLVIFDSPPVIGSPETTLLASHADGLIIVLQTDKTRWEVAQAARRDLEAAGIRMLGAVLNRKPRVIPEVIYKLL